MAAASALAPRTFDVRVTDGGWTAAPEKPSWLRWPAVSSEHGFAGDYLAGSVARLAAMIGDGVAVLDGTSVRVTDLGRPFIRLVARAFDLSNDPAAVYSRAV